MQAIPCDLSSTISTGSFLTSETLDVSPIDTGLSSDSIEERILKQPESSLWHSSLPLTLQQRQENLSGAPESQLPEGEMYLNKGSRIRQLLENCSGDVSSSSENNACFQALAAELDFPEAERRFPDFHHQLFQSLKPRPDFDISSSDSHYKISQGTKEFRKTSTFSTGTQDMSTLLEARNSSLNIQRGSLISSLETNKPNVTSEESFKENIT
ncbi:CE295 protein, partial [Penelope pileata]|nr:CE295 protein [Penelope pileata]